jgi:hypothetical protein
MVVDVVGYGSSVCFEAAATAPLGNPTAAVRRGSGCIDTDNNFNDFVTVGPIPRNSVSPVHSCGGDPTQASGLGIALPSSIEPASNTLLTMTVTPAAMPASTGLTVVADLTSIGGSASQTLYDDGTHGDLTAGDNVFSFEAFVPLATSTGVKNIVATIADAQGRSGAEPIMLGVTSPTCGVERWSVKVGTDQDVAFVDLTNPTMVTIMDLRGILAPVPPPDNSRVLPTEGTLYVVNATMTLFKKENDVDYHMVLQDDTGQTLIAEIVSPACIVAPNPSGPGRILVPSPVSSGVANARQKFDARFSPTEFFQQVTIPVQVTGIGFFDFIHGQTGVAPNGIELHPVLDITFTANTSTTIASPTNPSQFGQPVAVTAS